jgi:hypothetical protein
MTMIHDAYINALLADAAYVDELVPGMTDLDLTLLLVAIRHFATSSCNRKQFNQSGVLQ